MLQQTTVATALPYYERWMTAFPTLESLAMASEEAALALWQGLGYYSRCRNLRLAAQIAASEGVPSGEAGWLRMPGVGAYTAAALASICSGEPAAVVDGNVARVFARQTASDATGTALLRQARTWSEALIDPASPGDYNQALMELGATVCRPSAPKCADCPVAGTCAALPLGEQEKFPLRKEKAERKEMVLLVSVPVVGDSVGVQPVSWGTWWRGMWEFPTTVLRSQAHPPGRSVRFDHSVTNHRLTFHARVRLARRRQPHLRWVHWDALPGLPMAAPMRKALKLLMDTGSLPRRFK